MTKLCGAPVETPGAAVRAGGVAVVRAWRERHSASLVNVKVYLPDFVVAPAFSEASPSPYVGTTSLTWRAQDPTQTRGQFECRWPTDPSHPTEAAHENLQRH
jgi:hypothetical protein